MKYYMFNGIGGNKEENKVKKINKKKVVNTIIIIICILLIISAVVLYTTNEKCREILDRYVFRKEVYENNLPTIKIDSNKNISTYAYNKYISVLEENKLKLYNKTGKEETSMDVEISTPIFEANGDYLGIAEKNGQKLYLVNNKNIVWQKDIEGKISQINVNKNGYMSIVISGTSHKAVIKVFDQNGNELFTYYLSTTSVIDTDISGDNKFLAMAEVNFSGIVPQSGIKIISIEEAKSNSSEAIKYTYLANANDLIINIKYQNKNELVCMYDEHIDVFKEGKNTELINLKDDDALFADVNLSSKIVKVTKKSTGLFSAEAELQIINSNTKDSNFYAIESVPKSVLVQDNMITINLGTKALFINSNGWLVKKYQSSQEIQKILLCNDVAGIVSKNKIEIISL
jgi:hypothetical protein